MIIKTWNCTGLGPKLKTSYFRRWLADAEVVALQETFLDIFALQVAGFAPFVKPARPAPAGKNHRPLGGLITLLTSQLAASFSAKIVDGIDIAGFENLCVRF